MPLVPSRRSALLGVPVAAILASEASAHPQSSARDRIAVAMDRYARAWMSNDPSIFDLYHPAFTLHYFGRNALSGDHVGKDASIRALSELSRRTRAKLVRVLDTAAGDNHGVLISRIRLGREGAEVEMDRVMTYTIENAQLRECWQFNQHQDLIDELVGPT